MLADFLTTSCNNSYVMTSWVWRTDYYCVIRAVYLKYRCFSTVSVQPLHVY